MIEIRIIDRRYLDEPSWENLARRGSFYHTLQWVDICAKGIPGRGIFVCGYENDSLLCGMPAIISRRMGAKSFYSMPNGTYGAVLWSEDILSDHREQFGRGLIDYFTENSFSQVIIVDYANSLGFWQNRRFSSESNSTHILDLRGENDFSPPKKVMTEIKIGEKARGEVIRITDDHWLEEYYALYLRNELRHGRSRPLYEKRFYEAIVEKLKDSDNLYWNGLIVKDRLIGSQIHFIHNKAQYYWQAVSDFDKRNFRPDYRLLYDAIKYNRNQGVLTVNLGASPADAEGLVFFKERWGGRKFKYPILTNKSKLRKLLGR
ncbi:MAG: GNAT family N-acetyltransferase [candidate division Zixibacteria bacterium]